MAVALVRPMIGAPVPRLHLAAPTCLVASLLCLSGCRPTVDIGSNIIWSADHEQGDLSDWLADGEGGKQSPLTAVTSSQAHGGRFAVNVGMFNQEALWRQGAFPRDAYYSAWYFLPHDYQQITSWTIMSFGRASANDGGTRDEVTILNLRTLPGGQIVLFVFDNRMENLQWPLAVPPAVVPVGKWFQIEVFYRNANDDSGRMTVWLDGVQVYDITNRPSGVMERLYFALGNVPDVVTPFPVQILADDVAISLSRVGPNGVLPPARP